MTGDWEIDEFRARRARQEAAQMQPPAGDDGTRPSETATCDRCGLKFFHYTDAPPSQLLCPGCVRRNMTPPKPMGESMRWNHGG